ncbi:hypothetical protein SCORR_v1c05410 [Spiroplasma corruscae]|uniref:Uncharacterized protein n=2 Tax=Spiroplasma corruscae TaxID=216934 RepID=A0A222EPZ0_9MOLU|nr:hypothetical protein SCORR_v1c05410 [Spiroplasma corruscae]
MTIEDKIFYNNSINGRKKESVYSKCKEYFLMNSKCAKEVKIAVENALLKRDKEWERKTLERDKEWEQKNLERDKEIDMLKEKINKLVDNSFEM